MVHWDDFRFILALHRHGTMTAAAAAMKTNVATVSRRIERAGEALGTPVFQKEGGAWKITPTGEKFMKIAEDFEAEVLKEENNTVSKDPIGKTSIVIQSPPVILSSILLPDIQSLMDEMPGLQLTFLSKLGSEGLGEADILLRWGRPEHGRLVARKVGDMTFRAYGRRGSEYCGWVTFGKELDNTPPAEMGRAIFREDPRVRTGHIDHKVEVMKRNGLAGIIPEVLGDSIPELERLPGHLDQKMSMEFWYGYHASRREDATLRRVVNWIDKAFQTSELRGLKLVEGREEIKLG